MDKPTTIVADPESDPDPYRMILGLPDPDPLMQGTDPDLAPDPLTIKQN
jgi:hypothetical protein